MAARRRSTTHRRLGPGPGPPAGLARRPTARSRSSRGTAPGPRRTRRGRPTAASTRGRAAAAVPGARHRPAAGGRAVAGHGSSSSTASSPTRRYARIIPVQRPQEALTAHAVDATAAHDQRPAGPATGAAAAAGGDDRGLDRQRAVERAAGLPRPVRGREVALTPAARTTRACRRSTGPTTSSGSRTAEGPDGPDIFRREFGFPHHPGLLERALREFTAAGLQHADGCPASATTRRSTRASGSRRQAWPPR